MINATGHGTRHGLKWLLALTSAWLLVGLANQATNLFLGRPPCSCSSSSCLPLPRNEGSFRAPISWDFAAVAAAQEPAPTADQKPEAKSPDAAPAETDKSIEEGDAKDEDQANDGESLFDGESLKGWKESDFAGQGSVEVEEGKIVLGLGQDLTGITWDGAELPTTNYEIELEAMRVDGADFFCGLTFPVKEEHCSLIVGGWGGTVVGLSSIDRYDASGNDTTKFMRFEKGKWYKIKLRVTPENISAWIDDKQVVDFDIEDHKLSVRIEVRPSQPLGIACWQTSAALRNLRLRRLEEAVGDKPAGGEASPPE